MHVTKYSKTEQITDNWHLDQDTEHSSTPRSLPHVHSLPLKATLFFFTLFFGTRDLSSLTWDQTHTPWAVAVQSLNHWTSREVRQPLWSSLTDLFCLLFQIVVLYSGDLGPLVFCLLCLLSFHPSESCPSGVLTFLTVSSSLGWLLLVFSLQ